ncbi:uncharacterized protein [Lolium perenne]|uniref:uncharacterized protein n=1 Tax=Lolium perenne TaxID=4522 RepID=UPI003A992DB5
MSEKSSAPPLDDMLVMEYMGLASQAVTFREEAKLLERSLQTAQERISTLEQKLTEATNAREIAEAKAQGYADLQARVQKAAEEKCAKMEKTSADREILEHDASSRIKKLSRDLHGQNLGTGYSELQERDDDSLPDSLSVLEVHVSFAVKALACARKVFRRLHTVIFPDPQKKAPEALESFGLTFLDAEDPILGFRRSTTKAGVEVTIALVGHSRQEIDWVKVANAEGLNVDKYRALLKGAKKFSRGILQIINPSATSTSSAAAKSATPTASARTEV